MLKLLHHPLCPKSRLIRLALNEKNIPYDLKEIRYWERDENFMSLNPAGSVPVLLSEKNQPICGIWPIVEYLEDAFDARNLIGRQPLQSAETRRLVDWFANKFHSEVTKNLVWEKYFKKLEGHAYPNSKALAAGRTNILYHLDYIEFLCKNHRWLNGDEISLADLAAATQLSVLDYYGDVPWSHNQTARQWYLQIKARPSFSYLLNDKIAGVAPAKGYAELEFKAS